MPRRGSGGSRIWNIRLKQIGDLMKRNNWDKNTATRFYNEEVVPTFELSETHPDYQERMRYVLVMLGYKDEHDNMAVGESK